MDTLEITGLTLFTTIGVFPWEQKIKQRLLIDISVDGDFSNCQDQLSQTVDYALLCQQVTQHVESTAFALIETVAEHVARLIKEQFNVLNVTVRVSKPSAVKSATNVSITVVR